MTVEGANMLDVLHSEMDGPRSTTVVRGTVESTVYRPRSMIRMGSRIDGVLLDDLDGGRQRSVVDTEDITLEL